MMTPEQIVKENLLRLEKKRKSVKERRLAHLSELAELIISSSEKDASELSYADDIDDIYSDRNFINRRQESASFPDPLYRGAGLKNPSPERVDRERFVTSYKELTVKTGLSAEEKAFLCRQLWHTLKKGSLPYDRLTRLFFDTAEEESDENTISFVYGRASEQAARRFSDVLGRVPLKEASSFREACDDVFFSRSAYCTVPVTNGSEGRLSGFCSLIDRYDLKTVMTTEIVLSDSSRTEFALLKKNIEYIKPSIGKIETGVKIGISSIDGSRIAELITAAGCFDAFVKRIDTVPAEYSDGVFIFEFFFTLNKGADPGGFFLYLFLEYPQFVLKGFFPIIDFTVG